ncbi:MAG: ABC transporter ATP-binding protein [Clostridia bacterium]|nr:ABC transporter ATP-binding protein [Clostridia bacterium]
MARNLENLQKQYNSASHGESLRGGPGGGPPRGRRASGKPKNTGKTVRRLLSYVGKYKFRLIFVLITMLLTTFSSLCAGYLLVPIINRITLEVDPTAELNPSAMAEIADKLIESLVSTKFMSSIMGSTAASITVYIVAALIILGIVYLISVLGTYIQARLMLSVSQNSVKQIRDDLFNKLQKLPVRYFDSHPTGEIMSRFTNDVDNIDVMLNNSLTSIVSGVITLLGTFVFMLTTNVWLTVITIVFIPILIFAAGYIGKRSSKYYVAQQAAIGAVNGYIEETISGQKVIKVFNHEDECVEEMELINEDLRNKQEKAQFWGGVTGPIMHNISLICYAVTLGVGGVLMCLAGFTPGELTAFANYSKQFSMPINQLSMQVSTLFAALAGAERVFSIMDADPEEPDAIDAIYDEIAGDVTVKNVTFGYVEGKTVLKDISLYAHPGQKIAFVGSTGAGKTTITNLLNRFYDINEGEIFIDGKPLKSYSREHLRKNIAMVLQDTHLFTGTVRENIRYGRLDATDEEVEAAAKTASAHSFIMRLENGYDTILEGDGANLSQGQRQLLNIARAALSKAPILVLDEATSSVDTRTERHIEHGMDRLMKNRTTFVIAHRLSTVRNANAIMVLEQGRIIERGDHDDLLAMKGRYYELYTGKRELD